MKTNKLVNCPQCGGFGFTSTPVSTDYKITVCRAKTCELCHGAGVIEAPMTNADRIRAMSDEELAWELMLWRCEAVARHHGISSEYPDTQKTILEWLQQPAEEADHA